jgi:hypothetical protein
MPLDERRAVVPSLLETVQILRRKNGELMTSKHVTKEWRKW